MIPPHSKLRKTARKLVCDFGYLFKNVDESDVDGYAKVRTAPHGAPHHTAPHRTAPHRTAPHRTAPHRITLLSSRCSTTFSSSPA